jgi:hypothetical protein
MFAEKWNYPEILLELSVVESLIYCMEVSIV